MASIDQALRAHLAAQASIIALVQSSTSAPVRVYCGDVPQSAALPAISISVVSAQHAHTLKGIGGYCTSRLQLNTWADTHIESKALAEAVRYLLQGISQTTMSDKVVTGASLQNEIDLIDPPVDGKAIGEYHVAADYLVRYRESST